MPGYLRCGHEQVTLLFLEGPSDAAINQRALKFYNEPYGVGY